MLGHDLVFGELLVGDTGARSELLDNYRLIQHAATVAHTEVVEFTLSRRLSGHGVGWIDVHLLASAVVDGSRLWTADKRLASLARELHVSYEITDS